MNISRLMAVVIALTMALAWFDGVYLDFGIRNFTLSALVGLITILMWVFFKLLAFGRHDRVLLRINDRYSKKLVASLVLLSFMGLASYWHDLIDLGSYATDLFNLFSLSLFAIIVLDSIVTREQFCMCFRAILIAGFLASFIVIFGGLAFETERAAGIISGGNPNYAANRLVPTVIVFFILSMRVGRGCLEKGFVFSGFLFSTVALVATFSTGALVAVVVSILLVLLYMIFKMQLGSMIKIIAVVTIGCSVLSLLLPQSIERIENRVSAGAAEFSGEKVYGDRASVMSRYERDRESIEIILGNPFAGLGLGQSSYYLVSGTSHNNYLTTWLELGIIGVVLLVFIIGMGVFIPVYSKESLALQFAIIGISVHLSALGGLVPKVLVVFLLLRIVLWRLERPIRNQNVNSQIQKSKEMVVSGIRV